MREPRNIDDETAAYILHTRRPFEDLRQAAAQLAGILVLNASGANTASPDHPLVRTAAELHCSALEEVQHTRPTPRVNRHHRSLLEAASALAEALAAVRQDPDIDPVLVPLRRAYAHLQNAANTLPGFEMVSFEQGCCALHTQTRTQS
ncbi:MAG: hypothetical protein JO062_05555 [Bryobacterales bacterium]|nr:hypothetical protein [Bryobacterales bacterium]